MTTTCKINKSSSSSELQAILINLGCLENVSQLGLKCVQFDKDHCKITNT